MSRAEFSAKTKAQAFECSVSGCARIRRSRFAEYCETHYYRLRRTGRLDLAPKPKPKARRSHSHGYVLVYRPNHPAATYRNGYGYEHRIVFYDKNGQGPHPCHWCGKANDFAKLHVDHVNNKKHDNRPENLVAACPTCNQARGRKLSQKRLIEKNGVFFALNGERLHIGEWAKRLGVTKNTITWRIKNGWSLQRALTKPRGKTGPRVKK